jgi:hypothetical protein
MSFKKYFTLFILVYCSLMVSAQSPEITSFTPNKGPIGCLVKINGKNLTQVDTILLGGQACILVNQSATSLTFMPMSNCVSGPIYIANSLGNFSSSNSFEITKPAIPTGQQGEKLIFNDITGFSYLGNSVSISADGNNAIFGAPRNNSFQGAAWVFTRDKTVWSQEGNRLQASSSSAQAYMGFSVAMSADGNTAVVGQMFDGGTYYIGAALIYVRNNNLWSLQAKLIGSENIGSSHQGYAVAISADGNSVIVGGETDNNGSGAIWFYKRTANNWKQIGHKKYQEGTNFKKLGSAVSMSANGKMAIVSEPYNGDKGSFWTYMYSDTGWVQIGNKMSNPDRTNCENFGTHLALSADGSTAIVGAAENNQNVCAFIYKFSDSTWTMAGTKLRGNDAIQSNGLYGPYAGVGINANGKIAVLGDPNDNNRLGAVWVFTEENGEWTQYGNKLVGRSSNNIYGSQGAAVAISADGQTILSGAPNDGGDIGAVWVFVESENAQLKSINLSNTQLADSFHSEKLDYDIEVEYETENTSISIKKLEPGGKIFLQLNNQDTLDITSNPVVETIPLYLGNNQIRIYVQAENKIKTFTYTINIKRLAPSADLSSLEISGITLTPAFSPEQNFYEASIDNDFNASVIKATKKGSGAQMKLNIRDSITIDLENDIASDSIFFYKGLNTLKIEVVSAESILKNTYEIKINKAAPIGIEKFNLNKQFIIYPNPVLTQLNINDAFTENLPFDILDIQGKKVAAGILSANKQQINVSALEKGLYILRFEGVNFYTRFLKL